jgi:hypothetical protein
MAYIGKTPVIGNFQVCDAITVVDAQAAYTMQVGGVNVSPESANHMLVSLNGILQAPTSSFTVSGSTITFASNLVTGDVIDFIQILGNVLDLGVPSDNTVTTAKLSDSSVSLAKLTATGTKDATTFLRGDNTFAEAGGGIEMAQQWRLTTSFTGNADPIASNLEKADSDTPGSIGSDMTESSGVFTFPSTGIYKIEYQINVAHNSNATQFYAPYIMTTANNSTFDTAAQSYGNIPATGYYSSSYSVFIFDCVNTSTHKVRFGIAFQNTSCEVMGDTSKQLTGFTFTRLGDT